VIVHDVTQGGDAWFAVRCGVPSASNFDKILSPTGKPSTQASAYANKLIAEWLCGMNLDDFTNSHMQHGTETEPTARAFYEMQSDADVEQVGFITRDDGLAGASPDGLVGADGMLEIKCPAPGTHIGYLIDGKAPTKYLSQLQGQLYIAERSWVDFLSFHDLMPPVLVRVHRDEKYIAALIRELDKFTALMAERKEKLKQRGIEPLEKTA